MKVLDFLFGLYPPPDGDPQVTAWRRNVFIALSLQWGLGLTIYALLSLGLVPIIFPGFASAVDMKVNDSQHRELMKGQNEILSELQMRDVKNLETTMFDLRVMECAALRTRNMDAARSYAIRIEERQQQYRMLTARTYTMKDCMEL